VAASAAAGASADGSVPPRSATQALNSASVTTRISIGMKA